MSLIKKQTDKIQTLPTENIISSILNGEVSTAEELAELHNLSLLDSVKLLSSVEFNQTLQLYSTAKANIHFHTKGVKKLIDIANESKDNKESMAAIKILAQYTGNSKQQGTDVNVNLNLGSLIDKAEQEKRVPSIDLEEFTKV